MDVDSTSFAHGIINSLNDCRAAHALHRIKKMKFALKNGGAWNQRKIQLGNRRPSRQGGFNLLPLRWLATPGAQAFRADNYVGRVANGFPPFFTVFDRFQPFFPFSGKSSLSLCPLCDPPSCTSAATESTLNSLGKCRLRSLEPTVDIDRSNTADAVEPDATQAGNGHAANGSGAVGVLGDCIRIRGARVHNLQNIDVDIPRDKLVVITGPSGSGKSSLAQDTIFAEGQRQYIESLSVYARQFLHQMERPDVDLIEGLQPTISIDQRRQRESAQYRGYSHGDLRLSAVADGPPGHGVLLPVRHADSSAIARGN